jgi:ferredoxin
LERSREKRGSVRFYHPVRRLSLEERRGFDTVIRTLSADAALEESRRCLHCSRLCGKCVEVCPNRANILLFTEPVNLAVPDLSVECSLAQTTQILHLDDLCNECGNCETFCPHLGRPYTDKPTLFSGLDMFETSENSGFCPVSEAREGAAGFRLRAGRDLFGLEVYPGQGRIRLHAEGLSLHVHGEGETEVMRKEGTGRGLGRVTGDVLGLALMAAHCAAHHPHLLY